MDVELAWLRTWLEVVDSGGFARAAARLHLSQPRVSARVASLERSLGCVLIERRMRPLTLTDDGRRLLPRARLIVTEVDDTVSDLRATAGSITGKLAIASFASGSSEFLPGILKQLRTANPLLEIAVLDGDVQISDEWLADRRAAVALRPLRPEPADHAWIHRGIWREPFVVLAPPGHPILAADAIGLEDVAAHPMITIGDPLGDPSLGYEAWSAMQSSRIELGRGHRLPPADHAGGDGPGRARHRPDQQPRRGDGAHGRTGSAPGGQPAALPRCRHLVALRASAQPGRAGLRRPRARRASARPGRCRSRPPDLFAGRIPDIRYASLHRQRARD